MKNAVDNRVVCTPGPADAQDDGKHLQQNLELRRPECGQRKLTDELGLDIGQNGDGQHNNHRHQTQVQKTERVAKADRTSYGREMSDGR